MSNRRGISLIECLVTMMVMSIVATLGVTAVCLMMRAEGGSTERLAQSLILSRLAADFRRDVHSTDQIQASPSEVVLAQQFGAQTDDSIVYRMDEESVVRFEQIDGQTVSREVYRLPGPGGRFERSSDPPLVVLVYHRPNTVSTLGGERDVPTHEYRVEAVPGRDLRFIHRSLISAE